MSFSDAQAKARLAELGELLQRGEVVTSRVIRQRFGVSRATAKRDLYRVEDHYPTVCEIRGNRTVALTIPSQMELSA